MPKERSPTQGQWECSDVICIHEEKGLCHFVKYSADIFNSKLSCTIIILTNYILTPGQREYKMDMNQLHTGEDHSMHRIIKNHS